MQSVGKMDVRDIYNIYGLHKGPPKDTNKLHMSMTEKNAIIYELLNYTNQQPHLGGTHANPITNKRSEEHTSELQSH